MQEAIFQKLKAEYSPLGFGDAVLSALASSIAATGLVTNDNVDAVIAAQKAGLESLQKAGDKRVGDALSKAKTDAQKTADALKAELEGVRAQLSELQGKEKPAPAPQPAPSPTPAPAPAPVEAGHEWFKAERDSLLAEFEKRFQSATESNKALTEAVNALKAENDAMKAAEAARSRSSFINGKAKELGIPEWRVSEGFGIAGDATEEAITEHLTKVAENIRAQVLPSGGVRTPLGADGKPDMEQMREIAQRLVSRN